MGIQGNEEADLYTLREPIKHSLDHNLTVAFYTVQHESGFQTKTRSTSRAQTDKDMLNGCFEYLQGLFRQVLLLSS